jgi:hypothetical protein
VLVLNLPSILVWSKSVESQDVKPLNAFSYDSGYLVAIIALIINRGYTRENIQRRQIGRYALDVSNVHGVTPAKHARLWIPWRSKTIELVISIDENVFGDESSPVFDWIAPWR